MKRVSSRMSRISTDVQESSSSLLNGIPESKWQEFLEKEDNDMFFLGLREEIVQNCMKKIFEIYLDHQAVAFTVHCAYLAWVKVLGICYMFKDPGDLEDPDVIESWQPDEEPKTSIVDSWASECMKVKEPAVPPTSSKPSKSRSVGETSVERKWSESMESMSFMTDLFEADEEGYYMMEPDIATSTTSTRRRSIFTRTLSMPKMYLPMVEPQILYPVCKELGSDNVPKKKG